MPNLYRLLYMCEVWTLYDQGETSKSTILKTVLTGNKVKQGTNTISAP